MNSKRHKEVSTKKVLAAVETTIDSLFLSTAEIMRQLNNKKGAKKKPMPGPQLIAP